MSDPVTPRFLIIGQVVRPHGIQGELRLKVLTGYPERFRYLERIALSRDPEPKDDLEVMYYEVLQARLHQHQVILKLAELEDRNSAERLREQYVLVPIEEAVPLEEGEYYHYQLVGLLMYTDQDQLLGEVTAILETGANDVYVVDSPQYGELLIPAIPSVIQTISLEQRRITVTLLDGLLPDDA